MRMRLWLTSLIIAGFVLTLAGIVRAEGAAATGSISGTIVDKEGKAVAGAQISILIVYADHHADPKEVKTATSADDGTFKVNDLAASGYIIKASTATLAGNKTGTVVAGKDTAIGKLTVKPKSPPPSRDTPRKG